MEEVVGLSTKERARLVELELVKAGRQTLRAAAERLDLSRRQIRRIWKRFGRKGAKGLVHGGRGRPSNRVCDAETKRQSLEICRTRLKGFGPTLAAEKLAELGLGIDHETLRRWLMGEGLRIDIPVQSPSRYGAKSAAWWKRSHPTSTWTTGEKSPGETSSRGPRPRSSSTRRSSSSRSTKADAGAPARACASISSAVWPNMKTLSPRKSSRISIVAPSSVPVGTRSSRVMAPSERSRTHARKSSKSSM